MTSEFSARSTVEEASTPTQSEAPTPKHVFEGHKDSIESIVFLHDNVHVVSGSEDGTMRKWNCDTGLVVGEPWKGEGGWVFNLSLSPDGKTIACARQDGSVQLWNTEGEMIEGLWKGHWDWVGSLSWSPSGSHLASGSSDGTILIRNAESGQVDVGPIKTEQGYVRSLAYSPVGDRIASGGQNKTICIWDSKTGKLVVGPIKDLGQAVDSLVWSSDGTKLYSASNKFAPVFDSVSGELLHSFAHSDRLSAVALSPQNNVLACVGYRGVAQLWDTETHQQLGQPFGQENTLYYVSFSRDGRYLACGGIDKKLTLWLVDEIAPGLPVGASSEDAESFLDRDAKNPRARPGDDEGEGSDDRYKNFFQSSKTSLALAPSHSDSRPLHRRFWTFVITSRHRAPGKKTLPSKEHHKRNLFPRRAREKSLLQIPATTDSSERKFQEREHVEENDCPRKSPPDAHKKNIKGKGKGRKDSLADAQTPVLDDSSSPAEEREDQHDFQSSAPSGPSRHHAPGNSSNPLQQRPKHSFFTRHSGPRPVTIYAGRPRKLYWTAPRPVLPNPPNADQKNGDTNAQTEQSSSAAVQSYPVAQAHSTTLNQQQQQQQPQPQPQATASHPASAQRKEYNFGFWGNFRLRLALCCTPDGTDIFAVSPAAP